MTEIKNANDIYEKQNEPQFIDLFGGLSKLLLFFSGAHFAFPSKT